MKYKGFKSTLRKAVALYLTTGFLAIVPQVGNAAPAENQLPVLNGTNGIVGAATTVDGINTMNISGTGNQVINWESFSIGSKAKVKFANDTNYLNLVTGSNMSEIYGKMTGGNNVYLINPNGIIFGNGSTVNVGSLHVSTRPVTTGNFDDYVGCDGAFTSVDAVNGNIINLANVPSATKLEMEGINVSFTCQNTSEPYATDVKVKASGEVHVGYRDDYYKDVRDDSSKAFAGATDLVGSSKSVTSYRAINDLNSMWNSVNGQWGYKENDNYMLLGNTAAVNGLFDGSHREAAAAGTYGDYSPAVPAGYKTFKGKFEGNGFTVSNGTTALFGNSDGAIIENVKLDNVNIDSEGWNAAALVGNAQNTTIRNVDVLSGSVKGVGNVGGVVGKGYKTNLENVTNNATISSHATTPEEGSNFGGLVGSLEGKSVISNSINKGKINITAKAGSEADGWKVYANCAGGLVGAAVIDSNHGSDYDDKWKPEIFNSHNEGKVYAKEVDKVGGIVGEGDNISKFENNYNTGEVTGHNKVGGLVGRAAGIKMKNSYNTADVLGNEKIGGIAGTAGWGEMDNVNSLGAITAWYQTPGGILAALEDGAESNTVTNSYYANTASDGSEINTFDKNVFGEVANYSAVDTYIKTGVKPAPPKGGTDPVDTMTTILPTGFSSTTATSSINAEHKNQLDVSAATEGKHVVTWKTFSIGTGNKVTFSGGDFLNIVNGNNMSEIYGIMESTGKVYLINPNGIIFGENAQVNVGALGLSTRAGYDENAFKTSGELVGTGAANGNIMIRNDVAINAGSQITLEGHNITIKNAGKVVADGILVKASGYAHYGDAGSNETKLTENTKNLDGTTAKVKSVGNANADNGYAFYKLVDAAGLSNAGTGENLMLKSDGKGGDNGWHGDPGQFGNYGEYQLDENGNPVEKTQLYEVAGSDGKHVVNPNKYNIKIDGLGYTVDGLNVATDQDWCGTGLFRAVEKATVENVNFTNATVTGHGPGTGVVAGQAKDVIVRNVYASGTVTNEPMGVANTNGTAGIIGLVHSGTVILDNVASEVNVDATGNGEGIGGLIGLNGKDGKSTATVIVKNSYNAGNIFGVKEGAAAGGIVGMTYEGGTTTITNTYNTGKITADNAYGISDGNANISNSYYVANGAKGAGTAVSADAMKHASTFAGWDNGTWKVYEGYTAPLLTSLMKGTATATNNGEQIAKTYNGKNQGFEKSDVVLTTISGVTAADSSWGAIDHVNAGNYDGQNVYSTQLGYNVIDKTTLKIDPKKITVGQLNHLSTHTTNITDGREIAMNDVVGNDKVYLDFGSGVTATLDNIEIGEGHTVTYTGLDHALLTGEDAGNYVLDYSAYPGGTLVHDDAIITERSNPAEYLGDAQQSYVDTIGSVQAANSITTDESKSNVAIVEAGTAEIGDAAADQVVEIDGNPFDLTANSDADNASQNTDTAEVSSNTDSGNNESDNTNGDKEDEDDEEK